MKKTPANKQKKVKKRLGMGLSSLLSKDNELASLIKAKVESKVKTKISNSGDKSPGDNKTKFNILSNRENTKISNLRLVENTQSMMPIQNLVSGKFQPRKIFDQNELEELAESIKSNGILQPILVRSLNTGNSYEIIAGERRWRAAQLAKLHEVPVIVRDFDDQTALGVAMIENLQRTDLNIVEEAEGYRKLMNTFQYTQEKLSQHIGKSRSHIANILRMLSLPSYVRRHIVNGDLSFGHAKSLASLNDEDAKTVTNKIIDEDLNVRQTEKLVNTFKKSLENRGFGGTNKEPITNPNIDYLERELTNLLGLKVVFSHKANNTGTMSIQYKSLDQIQPVIDKLKWMPK
jgi:ParB family chromosome partitioning protein